VDSVVSYPKKCDSAQSEDGLAEVPGNSEQPFLISIVKKTKCNIAVNRIPDPE
jgi:hypothetical protein